MSDKLPISVFIIALNEGDRIGRTIESVRGWVDEIIVIDSGSGDDTVAVSEALGARVLFHAWPGYGQQKRFGEAQCRHDWLLNLDADEVASEALIGEIKALFAQGAPPLAGYRVNIAEILPGQEKPGVFAHKVNAIRLYDKRRGRFHDSPVHDTVRLNAGEEAGALHAIVEHRSSRGIAHSLEKINRYSTMQAQDMFQRGKLSALLPLRLLTEFPFAFCKAYFLRGYCLKGMHGFINAMIYGFSRFVRLAKAWEIGR